MNNTRLYGYQITGVRQLRDWDGRGIIGDEVGLGKTLQSLYYAWRYVPDDPPGPIVVAVPAHLKGVWKRQAMQHLGLRVEVLSGQTPPRDKPPPLNPNTIFVVNYEILVPPHWPSNSRLPENSWTAWLLRQHPRLVILDEGQRVKNWRAACSRACKKLCRAVPRALILTGTPLANEVGDLWALTNLVRPELFPSRFDFLEYFTHTWKAYGRWHHKGAKHLDELHEILSRNVMLRRRKADVLDQLPPLTVSVVPVEVDLAEYRRAEDDYLGWLEDRKPGASLRARNAEELSRLNGLKRLAGELKVAAVAEAAKDHMAETGGKLLIGALHYAVTGPLVKAFGRGTLLVDGRMSAAEKQVAFDQFNDDPRCRVMVANEDAAGTGWSCRATSDVWLAELPWRPDTVTQFFGRAHGVNRGIEGMPTHAQILVAEGTVEEDLCAVLERKASWAAAAVDGVSGAGDLPIHALVKAAMKERRKCP
jgi:SNF2 family DNA or RNA helicase